MQISRQQYNSINFKRIQLTSAEEKKAISILTKLSRNKVPSEIEQLKLNLFDMFDSYFQNELMNYSKKYTHKEDLLQGIYLRFFEMLNFVQNEKLPVLDFMSELNKIIKPNRDEVKEKECKKIIENMFSVRCFT